MNIKLRWKPIIIGVAIVFAALLVVNFTAWADEYTCTGSFGAITVDNLRVPQNATCILDGTWVEGNITVEMNAILHAFTVHVDGNIQAENAANNTIGGNLQAFQNTGGGIHHQQYHRWQLAVQAEPPAAHRWGQCGLRQFRFLDSLNLCGYNLNNPLKWGNKYLAPPTY